MTAIEFNDKYAKYLAPKFYGLSIAHPEAIEYLDKKFKDFIKEPNFKYYQIKMKFNWCRFYADGLSPKDIDEVEYNVNQICKDKS